MAIDSENKGVGKVEPKEPEPQETDVPEEEPEEGKKEPSGDGENPVEIDSSDKDPGSAVGGTGNFVTRAIGGLGNGFGKLSSAIGLPKGVTGSILGVVAACAIGGAGIGLANSNYNNIMVRQEAYIADDCVSDVEEAKNAVTVSTDSTDADAQMEENAKKLWAWAKSMGMTDEQAAGMIGNFNQEGSADPTSIERYYSFAPNERYQIGPWKASILGSDPMYDNVPSSTMDNYVFSIISSGNLSLYHFDEDGASGYCVGVGIMAWTAQNGYDLMRTARTLNEQGVKDSEGNPIVWYNFEYQVAAISSLTEYWNTHFNNYMSGQDANGGSFDINSVEDCSMAWLSYMERGNEVFTDFRNTDNRFEWRDRENYSKKWYSELQPQSSAIESEYADFANNVMSLIDQMGYEASIVFASEEEDECAEADELPDYDNGDLARAMLSYAWDDMATAKATNGTELYVALHDLYFPGDTEWYQSCDRGVATAVHWAGADDNYPQGDTSYQDTYLATTSDLWIKVGNWSEMSIDDLEPGDIFMTTAARRGGSHSGGHTFMYVSNEIIQEKYPSNQYAFISASKKQYSPVTVPEQTGWKSENYYVYRYIGDYSGADKDRYTGNASGEK